MKNMLFKLAVLALASLPTQLKPYVAYHTKGTTKSLNQTGITFIEILKSGPSNANTTLALTLAQLTFETSQAFILAPPNVLDIETRLGDDSPTHRAICALRAIETILCKAQKERCLNEEDAAGIAAHILAAWHALKEKEKTSISEEEIMRFKRLIPAT